MEKRGVLITDFLNNFFAHPYKIIASKGGFFAHPYKIIASKGGLTHHLKA